MNTRPIAVAAAYVASAFFCTLANAQQISIGTDLIKTMAEGNLNMEMTTAIKDNIGLTSSLTYDPWENRSSYDKSRSFSLGARFTAPFEGNPGVWTESGITALEFSRSTRKMNGRLEEGYSFGLYSGLGYSFSLPYGFRLDAGAFLWSGVRKVDSYSCRTCGDLTSTRKQVFLLPKEIRFTLSRPIITTSK